MEHQVLRPGFSIRSADVREALGVAPSTFSEILKRHEVRCLKENGQGSRGHSKFIAPMGLRKLLEGRGFKYPKPAKVIAFAMQKGGVGKTTSSYYVSQRMAAYGARVLVVDSDAQGNLTNAFHLENENIEIDHETPVLMDILDGKLVAQEGNLKNYFEKAVWPSLWTKFEPPAEDKL